MNTGPVLKKRVVLAENKPLSLLMLRFQIAAAGYQVVRTVFRGDHAVSAVAELSPEVLVMSVDMPVLGGIEATRQIMAQTPVSIILTTSTRDEELMKDAMKSGICSYLLKPISSDKIRVALKLASLYSSRRYNSSQTQL